VAKLDAPPKLIDVVVMVTAELGEQELLVKPVVRALRRSWYDRGGLMVSAGCVLLPFLTLGGRSVWRPS
jgi:hypothetical protein